MTCSFHARLIRNLLTLSARKNLNLSRRILSHFREIDPGTAFIVSVLAGSQTGQPGV